MEAKRMNCRSRRRAMNFTGKSGGGFLHNNLPTLTPGLGDCRLLLVLFSLSDSINRDRARDIAENISAMSIPINSENTT